MSVFRRRRPSEEPSSDEALVEDADGGAETPVGPYDAGDVPDAFQRLDLGALLLPPRPGMELRLELEERTKRVIAATVGLAGSTVQLQAFAAPRTEGLWEDIRADIAAQVGRQGGSVEEVQGTFGPELLARLPARTPDGRTGQRVARFVGVDGPRWFLRGVFGGPAAGDADAARDLEDVVRGIVVVRGTEAMAPRDLLPLRLPPQQEGQPAATTSEGAMAGTDGGDADAADSPAAGEDALGPLDPFHRGPEITERR